MPMLHQRFKLLTMGAALLSQAAGANQFLDPMDGRFDVSSYLSENAFGFLPVPVIISEPAVDQGLGLIGMFFHEDDEQAAERKRLMMESENPGRHLLPPSVSAVAGAYTGNESWMLGGGHFGFYREGRLRYQGGLGYGDIKLDYYSVGDIELPRPFSLKTQALFVSNTLKFRIGELPLYLGPKQTFIEAELSPAGLADWFPPETPPEVIDELSVLLSAEVTTSALGFELEFDTRDNFFTPTEGFAYTLEFLANRDAFGSDLDYDNWILEGLNYFRFSEQWRGGLRLAAETVDSDDILPPFAVPALDMRGIPAARYQGENVALLEGELTWQFTPRWSALAFVGAGWAGNEGDELFDTSSRVSRGLGFRYQIARQYGLHVGLDVAKGPEDTVWYIQVGSGW